MKFKGTLVLLLLFVLVGSFAYFYEYKGGAQRAEKEKASKKLFAEDKAKLKELRLQYPDKEIVGAREGDAPWRITAPISTTADGPEWDRVATNLADLAAEKTVEENPSDLKRFGLDPPVLKVSAKRDNGKVDQVWFGFPNPTGSSIYAKVPDKKAVVLVPNTTYQAIKKDLLDLRERNLLRFSEFDAVHLDLKNSRGAVTLAKVDRVWEIQAPVAMRADASEVSSLLNTLSFTKVSDFVDYNPPTEAEMGFTQPLITVTVVDRKEAEGSGGKPGPEVSHPLLIGASRKVNDNELYYARDAGRKDILLVERSVVDKLDKSLFDLRTKELAAFHRYEVDGIDIISGSQTLALRKENNQWYMGPAAAKPANAAQSAPATEARPKVKLDKVSSLLTALDSYRVTEFIDRPAALASYGLEKPRLEVVLWKGEDRLAQLLFGREARPSGPSSGDQRFCYMKVKSESRVKIINKDVFNQFNNISKSDLLETEPKP